MEDLDYLLHNLIAICQNVNYTGYNICLRKGACNELLCYDKAGFGKNLCNVAKGLC